MYMYLFIYLFIYLYLYKTVRNVKLLVEKIKQNFHCSKFYVSSNLQLK